MLDDFCSCVFSFPDNDLCHVGKLGVQSKEAPWTEVYVLGFLRMWLISEGSLGMHTVLSVQITEG